jgi:hypothetical protein
MKEKEKVSAVVREDMSKKHSGYNYKSKTGGGVTEGVMVKTVGKKQKTVLVQR